MRHFCGCFCPNATGHSPYDRPLRVWPPCKGALPTVSCGQCFWLVICTNTIPRAPAMAVGAHVAHGKRERRGCIPRASTLLEMREAVGDKPYFLVWALTADRPKSLAMREARLSIALSENRITDSIPGLRLLDSCPDAMIFPLCNFKSFFRGKRKRKLR